MPWSWPGSASCGGGGRLGGRRNITAGVRRAVRRTGDGDDGRRFRPTQGSGLHRRAAASSAASASDGLRVRSGPLDRLAAARLRSSTRPARPARSEPASSTTPARRRPAGDRRCRCGGGCGGGRRDGGACVPCGRSRRPWGPRRRPARRRPAPRHRTYRRIRRWRVRLGFAAGGRLDLEHHRLGRPGAGGVTRLGTGASEDGAARTVAPLDLLLGPEQARATATISISTSYSCSSRARSRAAPVLDRVGELGMELDARLHQPPGRSARLRSGAAGSGRATRSTARGRCRSRSGRGGARAPRAPAGSAGG